jgi:hypothetical protein
MPYYESIIPPSLLPEQPVDITLVDDQTALFAPVFGRGWSQRNSYGDPRWSVGLRYKGMRSWQRSRLFSALQEARGKFSTVRASVAQALRGNFPTTELIPNNDFSTTSVTGWVSERGNLRSGDGVLRSVNNSAAGFWQLYRTNIAVTQYAPYALRAFYNTNPAIESLTIGPRLISGFQSDNYTTTKGLRTVSMVAAGATLDAYPFVQTTGSGYMPGTFLELPFISLARCALVDTGSNYLDRPSEFHQPAWTKTRLTATASGTTAPDGTSTAETLTETVTSGTHYISHTNSRSSGAADMCVYGHFKQAVLDRDITLRISNTAGGADYAEATLDLSAGTIGAVTLGGAAVNGRAFVTSLGNGWYKASVIARLPTSTSITAEAYLNAPGSGVNYTGSTGSMFAWQIGATLSSVPVRNSVAHNQAAPAGIPPTGGMMYLKGLPASTEGLLLPGDFFEVNGELKQVTMSLDSDAAGRGIVQFRPGLARPPADNDPVIIHNPLGRFVLMEDPKMSLQFGSYTDAEFMLEEVYG